MAQLALLGGAPALVPEPDKDQAAYEMDAVKDAVAALTPEGWGSCLAGGGPVRELEQAVVAFLGVRYALAVSSGTVALELALRACGVGPGAEVILSPYDWGAAAGAVLRLGAVPVFADIDEEAYTLSPAAAVERVSERTRAIITTHIFGHPADIGRLAELAERVGCALIEDAAQALGARWDGQPVGMGSSAACLSLGWGKMICGGEGGVLVTDDARVYEAAVFHGQHPLGQLARMGRVGPLGELADNTRIHPVAAAVAVRQLADADSCLAERRTNCARLSLGLESVPGVRPVQVRAAATHAFHRYSPTFVPETAEGVTRELYAAALAAEGVPVGIGFVSRPLHLHEALKGLSRRHLRSPLPSSGLEEGSCLGDCPVAERRCFETGLGVGARWDGRRSAWVDQLLSAWWKVAENLPVLRDAFPIRSHSDQATVRRQDDSGS